jgi:hypothetical protein
MQLERRRKRPICRSRRQRFRSVASISMATLGRPQWTTNECVAANLIGRPLCLGEGGVRGAGRVYSPLAKAGVCWTGSAARLSARSTIARSQRACVLLRPLKDGGFALRSDAASGGRCLSTARLMLSHPLKIVRRGRRGCRRGRRRYVQRGRALAPRRVRSMRTRQIGLRGACGRAVRARSGTCSSRGPPGGALAPLAAGLGRPPAATWLTQYCGDAGAADVGLTWGR